MHLDTGVALDLLEGKLPAEQGKVWLDHLNSCGDCKQFYREYQVFHSGLRRTNLVHATEDDISRALQIFRAGQASRLRRFVAELDFDSSCPSLAAAFRGGEDRARLLVFRSEGFGVTLKISGGAEQRQLFGQLLEPGTDRKERAHVVVFQDSKQIGEAIADDVGEFHFREIPGGSLVLRIEIPAMGFIEACIPAN